MTWTTPSLRPTSQADAAAGAASALSGNEVFCTKLFAVAGNDRCCDCNSTALLTWASSNLGIVLCNECVGAHRSLGVHVSKPLSLKVDAWDDDQQAYVVHALPGPRTYVCIR